MILPIYLYGQSVLREEATDIPLDNPGEIKTLVQDLKDTLEKADGCGLAAPQVGISRRVVIVDGDGLKDTYAYLQGFRRTLINPVVTWESEETNVYSEGCLSIPGIYADVRRSASLTVEYYDENLQKVTETFTAFGARMVQHELEHLTGHLFVDDVAPIRRKMIAKKLQNITRGKVHANYKTK